MYVWSKSIKTRNLHFFMLNENIHSWATYNKVMISTYFDCCLNELLLILNTFWYPTVLCNFLFPKLKIHPKSEDINRNTMAVSHHIKRAILVALQPMENLLEYVINAKWTILKKINVSLSILVNTASVSIHF